ncbi:MAG: ribosomal protein S18-alanine N-acetyltransferase, partial [Acidimicrobiales bacterium]
MSTVAAPVLVPMTSRHLGSVRAIDELVYSRPWSRATWRTELADATRFHLVAGDQGSVVGHGGLLFVADEAHVTTVAVHPDHQGRGVATRLLLALLEEARRRDTTAVTLEVRAGHRPTQRFYGRFGFTPVGVRRRYYVDPVDDAVVMWLHDLAGERVT